MLVVGDLMLDRFVRGDVWRISPEAPVPVVQVRSEDVHPGGAGNVVANLAALGARPAVVGWVGRDAAGRELRALLEAIGADASGIVASDGVVTVEKTRIVAHAQQMVRLDREPTRPGEALRRAVVERATRALGRADAVVVSDYGKGAIGPELLGRLGDPGSRRGLPLLIDPKQSNFAHYRGATLVKPNALEARDATGIAIVDDATLEAAGADLIERWACESVLLSRGEHGISLFRRDRASSHFPTAAREVFDVTGAGDTVIAVAALALARGGSPEDAAWLANVAAGVVVGKVGTATLDARELLRAVDDALAAGMAAPGAAAAAAGPGAGGTRGRRAGDAGRRGRAR
ncbi:D-glycero-beta-D-manno-heptose-7-phosphate kinase [bacterium]|nr:D-glycero-beta-D-manno-heptose-7-phosphate kinase [bacterium]